MDSERYRKRHQFLVSPEFKEAVDEVAPILSEYSAAYCLIGGLAVAHYANPPHTLDIDLLVMGYWKPLRDFCKDRLRSLGWRVTVFGFPQRHAGPGRPEKGVRLYRASSESEGTMFDLILSSNDAFLNHVIHHSAPIQLQTGVKLRIAAAEDIVVIKTLAAREKDNDDVTQMYQALGDKLNQTYIDQKLEELGW